MKTLLVSFMITISLSAAIFAQGFDVKAKGLQKFTFKEDDNGRNQTTFHSTTPLDEVDGLSTQISGYISFDVNNVDSTLKGEISLPTESLKTGIKMRDKDLKESKWLDAEKYPTISFTIKKVLNVEKQAPNKLKVKVLGDFNLHGVTNQITVDATMTYLDESEQTRQVMPGDLLGIVSNFDITLSKYDVHNMVLGTRVSDDIKIGVNLVGTNKL
jgi:polyisoprenoid-binding protein YceI